MSDLRRGSDDHSPEPSWLPAAVLPGAQLNGVELHILVAPGLIITVIGVLYAVVPTVSRAYWVLAALATEVCLIMYVLMFLATGSPRKRRLRLAPEYFVRSGRPQSTDER